MTTKTYARVANGAVAELITLDAAIDATALFNSAITMVDVSTVQPAPVLGWTAAETAGAWSFAAPPPAAPSAPVVPQQVTIYQAKAVLWGMPGAEAGKTLLDDVNAWAAAQGGLLQLAWTEATYVTRTGNFVSQGAVQFNWSSATLDGMFIAAAAIQA